MAILKSVGFDHYTGEQMKQKVSYGMMQDVAKAAEMTWGVKCSIHQCQDQAAWDIIVTKYNPADKLGYYQKQTVTDLTLKSNKMPEYIFVLINDMVAKLNDSMLGKAQPLKAGIADETFHKPFTWEYTTTTSVPVFQPKYYSAPVTVGDLPKSVITPWNPPVESTPVTSLKEMYEQDSAKKAKKVKKPKLTAAELVKQKEAQQTKQDLNEQFKADTLKWVTDEYFKVSPILDYMKDNKNQAAQGGGQIQPNSIYAPGAGNLKLESTPTGENPYKKLLESDVIGENAEQKALQEIQKITYEDMHKTYLDCIAPWTQADTEKVVIELKHKAECPNKTKNPQK